MSISVNNQSQIVMDQVGDGVKWEGSTVKESNYGEILKVETSKAGEMVVTTSTGVLTFSANSPSLDEATEKFSDLEMSQTDFPDKEKFNWLEMASLILTTESLRKQTNRIIRADARDSAMSSALNEAKKIMEGAVASLVTGVIGGAISIGAGCFSLKSSLSSMRSTRTAGNDLKAANTEASMAKTQTDLSRTKAEIGALKAKPQPLTESDQLQLDQLKGKQAQLEFRRDQQIAALDVKIDTTKTKLKEVDTKFKKNQAELKSVDEQIADVNTQIDAKLSNPFNGPKEVKQLNAQKAALVKQKNSLQNQQLHLDAKSDVLSAKLEGLEKVKAQSVAMQNADPAQAETWETSSNQRVAKAEGEYATANQKMQGDLAIAQGVSGVANGVSQVIQQLGTFIETMKQAEAKKDVAEIAKANYEAEDATADMQSADKVVADFIAAWTQFLSTVQNTENRLVQA